MQLFLALTSRADVTKTPKAPNRFRAEKEQREKFLTRRFARQQDSQGQILALAFRFWPRILALALTVLSVPYPPPWMNFSRHYPSVAQTLEVCERERERESARARARERER